MSIKINSSKILAIGMNPFLAEDGIEYVSQTISNIYR